MTYYHKLGKIPHKRHTQFRQPDGTLYHEELMGLHGFSGVQSLLYHLRPPTQVYRVLLESKVEIPYEDKTTAPCTTDYCAPGRSLKGAMLSRAGCR